MGKTNKKTDLRKSILSINQKILFSFLLVFIFGLGSSYEVNASLPDQTIFSEGFETGTGNWVVSGNISASSAIVHGGTHSLALNAAGSAYKKFALTDINSPNRDVILYWLPVTSSVAANASVLSLEEGLWASTDKAIEMFWDGSHVYFDLYRYADGSRTSTTASSAVSVSNDTWHRIEIISNTISTQIKIDETPVQFSGSDSSAILTNAYNWLRFSSAMTTIAISDDDGTKNDWAGAGYISSGNIYRYKKDFDLMTYNPSLASSAQLKFYLDKDNSLVGNLAVDVNGQRALTLTNNDISPSNSNPSAAWYQFSINTSLLTQGTNSVVIYAEGATTNTALGIDTSTISPNRSAGSGNGGVTWNYDNLQPGYSAINGEYMVRLDLAYPQPSYVDDITVSKENVVDASDLFGRTFDAISCKNTSRC